MSAILKEREDLNSRMPLAILLISLVLFVAALGAVPILMACIPLLYVTGKEIFKAVETLNTKDNKESSFFYLLIGLYLFLLVVFILAIFINSEKMLINDHLVEVFLLSVFSAAASDSGAYFGGKNLKDIFPKNLNEKISKNKTEIGSICGVLATVLMYSFITSAFFERGVGSEILMTEGFLLGLLGIQGDLMQSRAKRACNIKDSGTKLKGHGGYWDRIDVQFLFFVIITIYYSFFIY